MNILALEASTSSAKAIIYSSAKGIIGSHDMPYNTDISDVTSQDPEGVYKTLLDCGRILIESQGQKIGMDIRAVALSSTWHSLLFTDKQGNPIGRTLTWADNSAAKIVNKYKDNQDLMEDLYKRTGCPTHSTFPLWKWMAFKEENKLEPDDVLISSQPEYLFWRMTGDRGVSRSVASGTGFMNIHTLAWDDTILEFAKLSKKQLAPLQDPEYTAPLNSEAADILHTNAGIPVVITGPDGALNQVGAGAMKDGIMTMSIGTSGAIRMAVDVPILPKTPSTWCYYIGEGKRLAGAATSGAGNCVNWFTRTLNNNIYSYSDLERMIDNKKLMDAPIFLPFIFGERSPGWKGFRLGGFEEIQGNHGLGDLYYSILEGILLNLYQCYEILTRVSGVPYEIRISGGIENSMGWLQMAADIFQRRVYTFDLEHASIMGAVAVALKVLGEINSLEDFKLKHKNIIAPREEQTEFYQMRFAKYMEWYKRTQKRGEDNS